MRKKDKNSADGKTSERAMHEGKAVANTEAELGLNEEILEEVVAEPRKESSLYDGKPDIEDSATVKIREGVMKTASDREN